MLWTSSQRSAIASAYNLDQKNCFVEVFLKMCIVAPFVENPAPVGRKKGSFTQLTSNNLILKLREEYYLEARTEKALKFQKPKIFFTPLFLYY